MANLHTISEPLEQLRKRIRAYIWCEGIAVALVWLSATFWVGLALDYLPVRLGGTEMPRSARLVLLALISAVFIWIAYRWIARRVWVPLRDQSLALLLERTHPELNDGLVTAVQMEREVEAAEDEPVQQLLYQQTVSDAVNRLDQLDLSRVFDSRPLIRVGVTASVLLVSILGFAVISENAFALWCKRLYSLSSEPYPRETLLEMVDWEGTITVPRGSDFNLRVRADANRRQPPPEVCTVNYRTAEGEAGRVNMSRIGRPRDGYQYYAYEGKPFRGVISDITFDVIGNDFRLKNQHLVVADRPQIVDMQIAITLPVYTGLLPRVADYRPGLQVPEGSALRVRAVSTKPLVSIDVKDFAQRRTIRCRGLIRS